MTMIAVQTKWEDQSDSLKTVIVMRCWSNEVKVLAMGHATETAEGWSYTVTIYTPAGFVVTYTSTVDTWRQVQDGVDDRVGGEWG